MEADELFSRWNAFCIQTRAKGDYSGIYEELCAAYSEPHRVYHNLKHIASCIEELDSCREMAVNPGELEMALWYHDFVYSVCDNDNEERSAYIAYEHSRKMGQNASFATLVRDYVLATKHFTGKRCKKPDEMLIIDIDLSILGKSQDQFDEYERGITAEYTPVISCLSRMEFNVRRVGALMQFLRQEHIYMTDLFREKYESVARANMERSIASLKARW